VNVHKEERHGKSLGNSQVKLWKRRNQHRRLRNETSFITGDKNKSGAQKPNEDNVSVILQLRP